MYTRESSSNDVCKFTSILDFEQQIYGRVLEIASDVSGTTFWIFYDKVSIFVRHPLEIFCFLSKKYCIKLVKTVNVVYSA